MKLLLILLSIIIIQARIVKKSCDGILLINGVYYEKEILIEDLDRPYYLTVNYETDELYFGYTFGDEDTEYATARIDLNTKKFEDLYETNGGFSFAIDRENNTMYVGSQTGIYIHNNATDSLEPLTANGTFVWSIFYKNNKIYYSVYPSEEFYVYNNSETFKFKDFEQDKEVHYFLIDDDGDIFFSNDTGLYGQKKGETEAVLYRNFDFLDISALTMDRHGQVYICGNDGIYLVDKSKLDLVKVLHIFDAYGLAFDRDNNIIYSDATKIVKLRPNKDSNC